MKRTARDITDESKRAGRRRRTEILDLLAVGSERMPDEIRRRETDAQHVGARVVSELERFRERGAHAPPASSAMRRA